MLFLVAKTMCGRTQLTMPCAAQEEGAEGPDPIPCKTTTTIGLYRNMQLDPHPLGKVGTPLEMLDRAPPWYIGKL